MGILGSIFGSRKALDVADNAINKIGGGLDQIFYTDEEKAQDALKVTEHGLKVFEFWLEMNRVTANESTARAITRRIVALAITFNFLAVFNVAVVFYALGIDGKADKILNVLSILTSAFASVVLFYLGYYGVTKIIDHFKDKQT